MNKLVLILLFLILEGCNSNQKSKILFIGNSLTYYNDMPEILTKFFEESKVNIDIESATYPGYSLQSHLNFIVMEEEGDMIYTRPKNTNETTSTENILLERKFEIVVLQERSGLMLIPEIVENEVSNSVFELEKKIGNDSKIFLYQNYPLNFDYPNVICRESNSVKYCTDTIYSVNQEMKLIEDGFKKWNKGKRIVRIGELFKYIMINEKSIELFSDEVHPSIEGSFLIALKFYKDISGKNCSDLKYRNGIDEETASKLKEIVDKMYVYKN